MRYLVKVGELIEKTDYIEKQLTIIDENIENLDRIKERIIWEGEASARFLDNYNNYIKELSNIENNILSINKYLMAYANNYGNQYSQLRKKYSKMSRGK